MHCIQYRCIHRTCTYGAGTCRISHKHAITLCTPHTHVCLVMTMCCSCRCAHTRHMPSNMLVPVINTMGFTSKFSTTLQHSQLLLPLAVPPFCQPRVCEVCICVFVCVLQVHAFMRADKGTQSRQSCKSDRETEQNRHAPTPLRAQGAHASCLLARTRW